MFKYMYFYNGAGVGAGDFNNDGLVDLFFASNQGQNKIFINKGSLKFEDVTDEAFIPDDKSWSTGVSIVDINSDGLLDIYVCKVGQFENLKSSNQLLVCQGLSKTGIPFYKDEAKRYGIDFSGFSTQAAFLDFDLDGDLDLFLLNHTVHQNGSFAERKRFIGTYDNLSGDRFYRNEGTRFTDFTKDCGINSSMIGYGLGIAVSDINLDGYPDLYIGNDFHENDYLYINQRNGTFKDELDQHIQHTSQFSMGVDIADVNNDAFPEIVSLDMMPSDPYILKRSLGESDYNVFNMKLNYGYGYQYPRNNLQYNKNGWFSEIGMYSGIFATDWSWAPLWMDFDNDGLKDLFISNGIPKRLNDIDYVNYVSNDNIQNKIKLNKIDQNDIASIDKFPEIKLTNKFFKNTGKMAFHDIGNMIEGDRKTFSNGSVFADLDNDGDLDVVVNNINDAALIYENKTNDDKQGQYIQVTLKGPPNNINALGTKIVIFVKDGVRTYEKFPVKGFQSSMEIPINIGLNNTTVDSIAVIWPDNTYKQLFLNKTEKKINVEYSAGLPLFNYKILTSRSNNHTLPLVNITHETGLEFKHVENSFEEFDREPLMPYMVSKEGPALAIGDANNDDLNDVFIGSSKGKKCAIFLQNKYGHFTKSAQPVLENDSSYEETDATWIDVNNDGNQDLVIANGGNEFYGENEHMQPRVFLNDGQANFTKVSNAFDKVYLTASCIVANDFNNDGFTDLFIGGRAVPWNFGEMPTSYLLQNDGSGHFKDVTAQYSSQLSNVGFVKHALWVDVDKDGDDDLVVTLEWDGIYVFINQQKSFIRKIITSKKGWWNFSLPFDVDGDGDVDFIAGNYGLNNRFKVTEEEPVNLYYNDFDNNGINEQIITYFLKNRQIPLATLEELQKQLPMLKKKFLYAADFAKADLSQIFTEKKMATAKKYTADYFQNSILINDGNFNFKLKELPWQAQLSSYKDAIIVFANNDTLPDVLLAGNFYESNVKLGRNDADYGIILLNKGNGIFDCESINGLQIKGQVKHIKKILIGNQETLILARNNDSLMVIKFADGKLINK